jgi:hypothetical protein
MDLTTTVEVTITFHNGHKDKIKLRGDRTIRENQVRTAARQQDAIVFEPMDRSNSNVIYIAAAGSYRSVEIARL